MANVIKLVRGDSRPSLVITLTEQTTGSPINLTGTSVVLKFREQGADVLKGEVPGSVVDPTSGDVFSTGHWFPAFWMVSLETTKAKLKLTTLMKRRKLFMACCASICEINSK